MHDFRTVLNDENQANVTTESRPTADPTATSRSATIYSVADRAGVSIATVSRVLQGGSKVAESTREKVLQAADELNYLPVGSARSLAVKRHEALGLVLPELSGPYYSELLMGFEAGAAEFDHSVVLVLTEDKPEDSVAVRRLATRVDGFAVLGSSAVPAPMARALHGRAPVVIIAGDPQEGIDTMSTENLHSATELTRHLIGHGRERLLFVGDPDAAPDVRDRYAGFVAAHREAGRRALAPVRIPFREANGAAFAERILAGKVKADALVCANDELALSIMMRLHDAGVRLPDELAIVGWDDVMTARYVRPGLTTVRQPVRELGRLAADRLRKRLSGIPAEVETHLLPTNLVIRQSCGCTSTEPSEGSSTLTRK